MYNGGVKNALDIANFFIEYSGYTKTQLQVQKMTYISHGYMLALYDRPFVSEIPEAWDHGPVFPSLYKNFKKWGTGVIGKIKYSTIHAFNQDELEVLENIFKYYGRFCGYFLSDITHDNSTQTTPWRECYVPGVNVRIPNETTKKYYTDLYERCKYDYR